MKLPRTPPINRRSQLVQQIHDVLVNEIVTGVLAPGAPINDTELRERFQVSRTPIREVMLRLSEEGLVEIYPQVGSYVSPLRATEAYEAQFVREHLECALVREAVENLTEEKATRLRDNLNNQRAALKSGDPRRFMIEDEAMHALIAHIADRPGVWQIVLQRKIHLDRIRLQALRNSTRAAQAFKEHEKISQAILARDADAAVQAMREHLQWSLQSIALLGLPDDSSTGEQVRKKQNG